MTVIELVKAFVNVTPEMEKQIREAMKFDPDMEVRICDDDTGNWMDVFTVEIVPKEREHVYRRIFHEMTCEWETFRNDIDFVGIS